MAENSVARMWGTCFAEALRERVMDQGGFAAEERIAGGMGREYRIPAEYIQRVMVFAREIRAVESFELADGTTTIQAVAHYTPESGMIDASQAQQAEERGDYPVSYDLTDDRPATPAVMFPADHAADADDRPASRHTEGGSSPDSENEMKRIERNRRRMRAECIARRKEGRALVIRPAAEISWQWNPAKPDPLADIREGIEARSRSNARNYSRKEMQTGCRNTRRAAVRGKLWSEAERIVNWLYQRPAKRQEIHGFYEDRGAQEAGRHEALRVALNELKEEGKIGNIQRGGKRYAVLAEGVKPRSYEKADFEDTAPEEVEEAEEQEMEQSFDPAVMAEMVGTGYIEEWDS